ncbi:unnamed protein product [Oppiella nova]|uniref:Polysaccharide biosynthesis domain-containing protein n=1 Tax=Oppiella nova TaxID=334625 RepID=A0A7R9MLI3_9ACAR|nr:unnamed protein product [Oppiella nova]CAG2179627.1 unnamed protein product [Oppiella nova]
MEVYFKLISSMPSTTGLRLTQNDDIIYQTFRDRFKELDIKSLTEETLKCDEAKIQWRQYCNDMQEFVEDFNFATLLRLDSRNDYSESNTIVVPRVQFVAIEVARNREGLNDGLNELFK